MSTAIIGLGNMGKGLATRLAGKTELILGTRDAAEGEAFAKALPSEVRVASHQDAASAADIVILALPYGVALEETRTNGALAGKVVVDISNPLKPDYSGLTIGHTSSAAEEIQKALPGAKVVKAFNTIFASLFDAPREATADVPVFVAGDDEAAVDAVAGLVHKAGFAVEKSGGLDSARLIEPVGMLNIRLGYGLGRGTDIAPSWVKVAA